ncbi:MAG: hypothetical protein B5766_12860 [Candidatus Lumbricidophila eiseniae]|uniref:HTH gntR-type domain-containing protein n=1 Tax=Candidatus Lumbricidiphila eiseniae TaxID=1969409 RepID=A0A2A6FMY6_9MICO|nr:MAG: hypothetical protein B5766_12860 [Candidatus Lumbricidophila eiseniae]
MTGLTPAGELPAGVPQIVAAIDERIVSGTWPEHSRLPSERTLAEQFSVSRPVIRESLRVLSERGLIVISAGRGSFVRRIDPASQGASAELLARRGAITAEHLIVARTMLEAEAAALAAINRTDQHIERLSELLEQFDHSTVPESADLDVAFHEAITVASGNPVIQVMFASIKTLAHGIVLRSLTDRKLAGAALPLHEVILTAIIEQDPDRARQAMSEHLGAARQFYGTDLNQPLADVLRHRAEIAPALGSVLRDLSRSIASTET